MIRINAGRTATHRSAKVSFLPAIDLFVGDCGTIICLGWLVFYLQITFDQDGRK